MKITGKRLYQQVCGNTKKKGGELSNSKEYPLSGTRNQKKSTDYKMFQGSPDI